MSNPSTLHAQARRFAEAGIKVFPCLPNAKQPATPNGFHDATADVARVDAWWGENENYNIGLCPEDAGWCVVDIDPGGEAGWIEALADGGYDPTYEVQTPRGGRHLYFEGSLPSTASKLAPHVDTRGVGGYVLVPPSIVSGKPYEVLYDREIAPVPAWIGKRIAKADSKKIDAGDKPLDTDIAIARATGYLRGLVANGDVAISDHGGNDRTLKLFAQLKDLGVSADTALRLVREEWNPACEPPWELADLTTLRDNGFKYAQNSAGAATDTRPAEEAFPGAIEKALKASNDDEPEDEPDEGDEAWPDLIKRYRGWTPAEGAARPPITFFDAYGMYPRTAEGSIGIMYGEWGSGKSTLAVSDFIRLIRDHINDPEHVRPVRVAYAVGEGRDGVLVNRVPETAKEFGIDLATLGRYWQTVPAPPLTIRRHVKAFVSVLATHFGGEPPDIVVIDTLASSSGRIEENSDAIGKLFTSNGVIGWIKQRLNGAMVLVLDHSGKDSSKGVRGHSSKESNADFVIEVEFDKDGRRIKAHVAKQKDAPDNFEVEYNVTPYGRVPVATPIGKVDPAKQRAEVDEDRYAIIVALEHAGAVNDSKSLGAEELAYALAQTIERKPGERPFPLYGEALNPAEETLLRTQHNLVTRARKSPNTEDLRYKTGTSRNASYRWRKLAGTIRAIPPASREPVTAGTVPDRREGDL